VFEFGMLTKLISSGCDAAAVSPATRAEDSIERAVAHCINDFTRSFFLTGYDSESVAISVAKNARNSRETVNTKPEPDESQRCQTRNKKENGAERPKFWI